MKETIRGPVTSLEAAWRVIGDTDHLNRLAANPPLVVHMVPDDRGYPEIQGSLVGPGPIRHRYVERDSRWLRDQWFEQDRVITGPLMRRTHYRARLIPAEGGGVIPEITLEVSASNALTALGVDAIARRGLQTWKEELDRLPAPGEEADPPPQRHLPQVVLEALARWRSAADPSIVDRVEGWLQGARPAQLRTLRPFALADQWGLDRRAVLVAMLEGAKSGALELYWTLHCPRCDAGVGVADTLSNLADQADCPSCRIHFGADLADNVEVMLAAHPAIRPPAAEKFCTLYPADRPDVLLLLTLDTGAEETVEMDLPPGRWFIGAGGAAPDLELVAGTSGCAALRWSPEAGAGPILARSGPFQLTLANPTPGRLRIQCAGEKAVLDRVSAAWLSTMPEYRRTFGAQVLAPDVRIAVKAMAILFTDLTGSASLYHEQGDAQAFKLVHDHFAVLEQVVERFGGVRIKTIGDALMAAFNDPGPALAAAIAMHEHFDAWAGTLDMQAPPGLKIGLHYGPVMAVHTDQAGLDFFGGTVNLAARCEGRSGRGQVIWTESVNAVPAVSRALDAWGGTVEPFSADIKGIPGPQRLFRAQVGAGTPRGA